MLPQHTTNRSSNLSRYVVQSSDVIADMKVNILDEKSEKVLWYKERFLSDDEIVDNLVDSLTSTICWTIHRPKRGWYIRIRSPSFPPGVFIPIVPLPHDSPYHSEAALSFSCRANVSGSSSSLNSPLSPSSSHPPSASSEVRRPLETEPSSTRSSITAHSYPPTPPPAVIVRPPSPNAVQARLNSLPKLKKLQLQPRLASTRISDFILAPDSAARVSVQTESSLFARVLTAFKNNQPSPSYSFSLCLLPPLLPPPPPPPYTPNTTLPAAPSTSPSTPTNLTPFLTFHDRTPLLTVHAITGLLEIDKVVERSLGVQGSFWIAVALTYLGFLEDRESYLAASND